MRLALVGSGDAGLAARLHELAAAYPDSLTFVDGYDEALSHLMFAGADLHLMPSRFDLLAALFRAERRVRDRRRRAPIQTRVMAIDWSWRQPASEDVGPYRELVVNPS